jgi:hypothetical protein
MRETTIKGRFAENFAPGAVAGRIGVSDLSV